MAPQAEVGLPATLATWLGEIVRSAPAPAQATLAELLLGAMLAYGGHVTQAILAVTPRLGWQAYHWMIERGRFRLLGLVAALCGIVRRETDGVPRRFAVIDDTLAPRPVGLAPDGAAQRRHQPQQPEAAPLVHPAVGLPSSGRPAIQR